MKLVLAVTALSAVASAAGTWLVLGYARRGALIDLPNERSLHATPTPRGGGLPIAVLWIVAVLLLWLLGQLGDGVALAIVPAAAAMAWVGWRDDHVGLPVVPRLGVQLGAAAWTVAWLGGVPELDLGSLVLQLGGVGAVIAVVGLVWLVNLYNFMDGSDGLAGSEALVAGGMLGVLLWTAGAPGLALLAWVLAAAAAGFLVWNWAPARIFMGDVGSLLLGYAFGALALAGSAATGVPIVVLLLPLGAFIADATFTLAARLLRCT